MSLALATARTWAEIDLDHILYNYQSAIAELRPGVQHIVVLKANAYGLGATAIGRALYAQGARLFAVACATEALELRGALAADADILIMGPTMPPEMDEVLRDGIMPTLFSLDAARQLSEAAEALGVTARVHCKVDTGLSRLGFMPGGAADAIEAISRMPHLSVQGLFSHLQRRSPAHDRLQADRLRTVYDALATRGVSIPMLHLLDSIGMWRYPENQFDAVRDGAYLFGHTPKDYPRPEALRFALSFKTRIARIETIAAGECLGYDCDHPLQRDTRVATLCAGYADGYPRSMSHRAEVEIHGRRARVLGVVCMDLMMVDIDDIPEAAVGDEAILLGGSIDIWTYAGFCGGYNNECLSMISRRTPRVYLQNGEVREIVRYL